MRSEPPAGDELDALLASMKSAVLARAAADAPPRPRSSAARRITGLAFGITALLGLGAGAAFAFGALSPTDRPQPDPMTTTAAPTVTAIAPPVEYSASEGAREPMNRYGLACGDLVPDGLVDELLAEPVEQTDPLLTAAGAGIGIPLSTSVVAEGGLACGWSNDEPHDDRYHPNDAYRGILVHVLPGPPEGWSYRAQLQGLPGDQSSCSETRCSANIAAGDSWISLDAVDPAGMDATKWLSVLVTVGDTVSAIDPAPGPAHEAPLPTTCSEWLPLDTVREIATDPEVVEGAEGGGGWSDWAEARLLAGNGVCNWSHGMPELATLEWVNDGGWAYERMLLAGRSAPLALEQLASSDAASIRCDDTLSGPTCAVDLRLGPDWVSVRAADRELAIGLAEAVVQRMQGSPR